MRRDRGLRVVSVNVNVNGIETETVRETGRGKEIVNVTGRGREIEIRGHLRRLTEDDTVDGLHPV